ncbi:RHS repeat-associated core domain-containing protein [uncultured Paludibaculum sp.]|uniref:RHS repeat domain-containing protein n=1 Tax=uncultured Paludibaculum sp. TaxID=1765020 RepID=UPI002AAA7832|nr:RHS repeat-associated core domain-containing protein [uncultured Paludibaculum sp.]
MREHRIEVLASRLTLGALLCNLTFSVTGQITTAVDGATPPVLAAGRAAGSYALSDFESVNLFGGGLSFLLPIVPLGGQGAPGAPVYLTMDRRWVMQFENSNDYFSYTAMTTDQTDPIKHYYSPGELRIRSVGRNPEVGCNDGADSLYRETLTRLTFREADGTEHEFVDATSGGNIHLHSASTYTDPFGRQVKTCTVDGTSRGRVWVTRDGTFQTYIVASSAGVVEYASGRGNGDPGVNIEALTGYLYKKDGTRLKIVDGRVSEVRDRNGRFTTYTYGTDPFNVATYNQVISITDPMGRTTTIDYQKSDPYTGEIYTALTYKGTSGSDRTVEVHYCGLVSTCPYYEHPPAGKTVGGTDGLFPGFGSTSTIYAPGVVSYVKLPDGRRYEFRYNSYGELAKVTLPTGGSIEYVHGSGIEGRESLAGLNSSGGSLQIYRRVLERRTYLADGSLASKTKYKTTHGSTGCPSGVAYCTIVTEEHWNGESAASVLAATRHTFVGGADDPESYFWNGYYIDYLNGKELVTADLVAPTGANEVSASGYLGINALKTASQTWAERSCETGELCPTAIGLMKASPKDPRVSQVQTTLVDSSQTSTVTYGYDRFNNKTLEVATGYDGTVLYRRTAAYLTTNPVNSVDYVRADLTTGTANNSIGVSSAVVHLRGLPVWAAECLDAGCSGTKLAAKRLYSYDQGSRQGSTGITQWDSTVPTARGNLTMETGWLDSSGSSSISVSRTYYDYGAPYEVTDGRANKATYEWGCNGTAISKVKNALNDETTIVSDCNTGSPTSIIDPNAVVETRQYTDALDRLTSSTVGSYAKTLFSYDDSARAIQTRKSRNSTSDSDIVTELKYDGLGRTVETNRTEPGVAGSVVTRVSTMYDLLGRVWKVSQPFQGAAATAWTETLYDSLGRPTSSTTSDGSATTTTYDGATVTTIDPAHMKKKMEYDALGRLANVTEYLCPTAGGCSETTSYTTTYSYDTRANLTGVMQGAQSRTFSYDMLGRLHSATNPESGTVTYGYDGNGNVTSKTDARGTVTMGYDALNRIASKSYSGTGWSSTPSVTYSYDATIPITGVTSESQPKGRLVQVSNSVSTTSYQYDGLGRPLASVQTTDGLSEKVFQYSYVPAGLSLMTYPSGRKVNWSYDLAGRPDTVLDGAGGAAFATAAKYDVTGGLSKLSLGSGLEENWTYSSIRGQVRQVTLGTPQSPSSVGSWQYSNCVGQSNTAECATNNGNVMSQTIGPLGAVQTYGYDGMNRLKTFSEGGLGQTYVYDQYGNRALLTGSTMPSWPSGAVVTNDQPDDVASIFPSNQWNQSTVVNGYVTKPKSDAYPTLSYDAEGRIAGAVTGATESANASYGYDGEGRRVQRTSSGVTTYYVYDAMGQLAAEYGGNVAASGRQYLTVDALGSTRVVTDQNKAVVPGERHDYMPFGGALLSTQNGRTTTLGYGVDEAPASLATLFTSKERDAETGLDYFGARYFSAAQGRFTSPDSPKFSEKTSPQTWNLYSYTANNPLSAVDLTGNNWFKINGNWSWYDGSDVDDNGDACKKGSEGCNHSDYTLLLRIQKTGKYAKDGAEIEKLALLGAGEDDVLATGTGYTGKLGTFMTTPNGDYEINLNRRGGLQSQYFLQVPQGYVLGPYPGIQRVGPVTIRDQVFDARNDWGDYRANLVGPKGATAFYLHGKLDYFDHGRTYTHGCTTEPLQNVLKVIFRLDPKGVGEGEKNGRILVNVSGK